MKIGPWPAWPHGGVVDWSHYAMTGATSIEIIGEDGDRLAVATVCPDSNVLTPDGHVWLRSWNECEGLPDALERAGVVELQQTFLHMEFVTAQLGKLTSAALAELRLKYAAHPEAAIARDAARARPG